MPYQRETGRQTDKYRHTYGYKHSQIQSCEREREREIDRGRGGEREGGEREGERERVLAEKVIRQSFQSALSDFNLCGGNEFPRFGFQVPGLHATYDTTCQPEENFKTFWGRKRQMAHYSAYRTFQKKKKKVTTVENQWNIFLRHLFYMVHTEIFSAACLSQQTTFFIIRFYHSDSTQNRLTAPSKQ